jgi:integrase
MKLTDAYLKGLKPSAKPTTHPDGGGLTLYCLANGTKTWRYRYRYLGKPQTMTFGKYPDIGLKVARSMHSEAVAILSKGRNPMGERKREKLLKSLAVANSLHSLAEKWFEHWSHGKDAKTISAARGRLDNYVIPQLGYRPVSEITTQEFAAMARKIESSGEELGADKKPKPLTETAERCLRYCGQMYDFAIANGLVENNPARSIKPATFLKAKKPQSHARVEEAQLPGLLKAVDGDDSGVTRLALQLMSLIFVRTKELIEGTWDEIDFDAKQWRIPVGNRMKEGDRHIIPLSNQAIEILKKLKEISGGRKYIFPSKTKPNHGHMSNGTMLGALKRLGYKNIMTGHGFRSVASTILHEKGFSETHIETQLAHLTGNKVSRSYNAAKYIPERTRMMQEWADYLDAIKTNEK